MGKVIDFEKPVDLEIEYDESSTIVEQLELTDEMRAEFEELGYTFEEYDNADKERKPADDSVRVRESEEPVPTSEPGA